ncbi:rhomboid family intramembrane serine protease [Caldilinea sp.]|uniref:rhomboid family intramembrane serine protease n=1 Tax=Caldilinea sp. TaxID=2293560 RepID=UPI002C56A7F6|nr:rhomboid family intramembrane serine protease [Caldilinea sp.]HRA65479.1 rhomboid family intramembrane serine protease [Caldilinea sp.]
MSWQPPGPPSSNYPPSPNRPPLGDARPQFYIKLSRPLVTQGLLGVILAVFVAQVLLGFFLFRSWTSLTNTNIDVLILMGAKVNPLIAQGEVWRLFTAIFLHGGVLHLLFNLYALYALGPLLEGYTGHIRFLTIFLVSGLYGSLLSYALSGPISVGASGAIFGLLGGITVFFLKYRDNFGVQGRAILQNMIVVLVLNLVIGFSSGFIDNWGHIGGLIGGALVTVGIMPRYRQPAIVRLGSQPLELADRRQMEVIWVIFCLILLAIGVYAVTVVRFQ